MVANTTTSKKNHIPQRIHISKKYLYALIALAITLLLVLLYTHSTKDIDTLHFEINTASPINDNKLTLDNNIRLRIPKSLMSNPPNNNKYEMHNPLEQILPQNTNNKTKKRRNKSSLMKDVIITNEYAAKYKGIKKRKNVPLPFESKYKHLLGMSSTTIIPTFTLNLSPNISYTDWQYIPFFLGEKIRTCNKATSQT